MPKENSPNLEEAASQPPKIFPRNLTARAAYQVVGNPVTTRPEDTVANCYPGLDMDVRNLDCRFFPGLLFKFVDLGDNLPPYTDPQRRGAKLMYVDNTDPALGPDRQETPLYRELVTGAKGAALQSGTWFLKSIEQNGKTISMYEYREDGSKVPLEGLIVWRLVRSLEPGPLTITLVQRDANPQPHTEPEIELKGWRRHFVDPTTGVIDAAYKPGELAQSLCSPWTHDFRDCACHYWASNHPDVVHGPIGPEQSLPDGESADPVKATTLLDWLREDRSPAGAAAVLNTISKNRPFQMDHYQINHRWEELSVVIQNNEIGEVYQPIQRDEARPFPSSAELVKTIRETLAPLEMALALEYLYARYSIIAPEEAPVDRWPTLKQDVTAIRHYLMLIAAGEMTHLRWANQLLWELHNAGFTEGFPNGKYEPVLEPATRIPVGKKWRPRALRPLMPKVLDDFIKVEEPSGAIEGAYARVVATLRQPEYPNSLYELALRIDSDGVEHYSRFSEIKVILKTYESAQPHHPYLRPVTVGTPAQAKAALDCYATIRSHLGSAYVDDAASQYATGGQFTQEARTAMIDLNTLADQLAAQGIGIPFWTDAAATDDRPAGGER